THDLWSMLRTDTAFHRTYWVKEWPRCNVGPDWLAPLLVRCRRHLRVAVTMEPISAAAAEREVRGALAEDVTNERLRERAGWRTSARSQRETEQAARRESEMADGWSPFRYSAYLTVTAASPDELEDACSDVEQQAVHSRLQLRRMCGEQGLAFTYTLPLCRGLR
ncbi:MAG TPA: SCO6880 family protein, partial [Candidatus Dormibacteraeota bacterium]|nr:SCO6880 family protein [Candidatus Dormibacteraeota bacterium]